MRQASELGGEVKLRENPPVIGDIRAGAAFQGSLDSRQYICREAKLDSLHPPGHSPTVAFGRRGRGALCHCRPTAYGFEQRPSLRWPGSGGIKSGAGCLERIGFVDLPQ